MKLKNLLELEGDFLPKDKSSAADIARDLYSGANGDTIVAKKMAERFLKEIISAIDAQGTGNQSRPTSPRGPGYEQQNSRPNAFDQYV